MPSSWLAVAPAAAEASSPSGIDWFLVITGLFGGLAVFLIGMDRMTDALRVAAGARVRHALARMTRNRVLGAASGAGVTAVIQSSSVTTVLVVGFISSGVLSLSQGIPVILGANVGTTITAQIVAFDVARYALMIVAVGYGLTFFGRSNRRVVQGDVLLGLGLVFFGMSVMGESMAPLRTYDPFIDLMGNMENPLLAIMVGLLFTALVQSSSATTGIVIVLAAEGLIAPEAGIALVLGANVGTSVTAQLAALGKPPEAVRAAAVHSLFNLLGALAWLPLVGVLASVVDAIGGPTARQVANAHTIFNVTNTVVCLGLVTQLERLVVRLVPDAPDDRVRAKYLDDSLLATPTLALEQARLELLRMATRVRTMLVDSLPAVLDGPPDALDAVATLDDEVDDLHAQIIVFLGRVGERPLNEASTKELVELIEATNNLEAIGDLIETNLVALGRDRANHGYQVGAESRALLEEFHHDVLAALDLALSAMLQSSEEEATTVVAMKGDINEAARRIGDHHTRRLAASDGNRIELYRFETDLLTTLRRVYYFTRRTARVAVPGHRRAKG